MVLPNLPRPPGVSSDKMVSTEEVWKWLSDLWGTSLANFWMPRFLMWLEQKRKLKK